MNRITTILSPDPPPSVPPSPRSLSLTAPAVTTQRVAQHLNRESCTPGPSSDSPPAPKAGAQCGSSARWDLCGGRPATAVPTATE